MTSHTDSTTSLHVKIPSGGVTFAQQQSLKKLPIPPLDETLNKFLNQTVKPFLSEKEWEDTRDAVENFKKGEGPQLHAALKEYEKTRNSYIEEFWDAAYLEYDVSVACLLYTSPSPRDS